jgi:hypothetical protein
MTLAEFLLARIADDEATATAVTFAAAEARDFEGGGWYAIECNSAENETHWYRWTPERVLAECEAKRRIVAAHPLTTHLEIIPDEEWDGVGSDERENTHCAACYGCGCCEDLAEQTPACATLRLLAQPYANHSDFQPEWASAS